ncbi:MAG: MFS transporter [Pseudomonadota bacterium]
MENSGGRLARGRGQGAWGPLGQRNYRLFFGGQLISLIGTWTQNVAQAWLIYALTGSSLHLGLVGFAGQVPVFLLALLGGTLADRVDRRRLLVATQSMAMLLAFTLAALTMSGLVREWHVICLAFALGVVNAVDMPTRQSFLPEMVERRMLHRAIGLNSSMFNGARMAGPALAGWLVAAVGEGWCFVINGLSFLAVILGLLLMRLPARPAPTPGPQVSTPGQIGAGLSYAWQRRAIRGPLMMLGLSSLLGAPYLVLMPVFASRVLGGGPGTLGLLMGASGLGALIAALYLASRSQSDGLERWPYYAAAGFGLCLGLFSLSSGLALALVLLVPTGFCMMLQAACTNTLLQQLVPDHLRGRVMAVYVMMFMGSMPFGSLLEGALARVLGVRLAVGLGAGACLIAALISLRKTRGNPPRA